MRANYFGICCSCWQKVTVSSRLYTSRINFMIWAFRTPKTPSPPPPPPLVWGWLRPCSSQCVLCFILVPRVLLNCLPIIHGLFSSILKFWEQCREPNTCDCPAQLYASVQMMSILRKAMWLPRPLCLGGDIFHIISPKEIHKLLETIWAFFKVSCVAS